MSVHVRACWPGWEIPAFVGGGTIKKKICAVFVLRRGTDVIWHNNIILSGTVVWFLNWHCAQQLIREVAVDCVTLCPHPRRKFIHEHIIIYTVIFYIKYNTLDLGDILYYVRHRKNLLVLMVLGSNDAINIMHRWQKENI